MLSDSNYSIIHLKLSYTKRAHYSAKQSYSNKNSNGQFNFNNSSGNGTVNNLGHNSSDETETIEMNINLMNMGITYGTFTGQNAIGTITLSKCYGGLKVNPNGGSWNGSTSVSSFTATCQSTKNIADPTRTGYTFNGWSISNGSNSNGNLSGKTFTYCGSSPSAPTGNSYFTTLTANWKINQYTVTCIDVIGNSSSGTQLGKSTWSANYGTTAYGSTKGSNTTENTYYNGYYYTGCSNATVGSSGCTVYRYFNPGTWSLTVNPNGGSWNNNTNSQSFNLKYKTTKAIAIPTRTGYTFNGWSLTGNGSSMSSLTASSTFTMGYANATLTANWKINQYTVTCIDVIGNSSAGTQLGKSTWTANYGTTAYGSTKGSNTTENTYYNGYYYTGCSNATVGTSGCTVYRYFNPGTWSLTVNPNGGSWNNNTNSQSFNLKYKSTKAIAIPTRTGYTFNGWKLTGNGSSMTSLTASSTFTMGYANATLTANWNRNSHMINVKYIEYSTKKVLLSENIEVYEYDEYIINPKAIEGYVFLDYPDNYKGTMKTEDLEVIYYYGKEIQRKVICFDNLSGIKDIVLYYNSENNNFNGIKGYSIENGTILKNIGYYKLVVTDYAENNTEIEFSILKANINNVVNEKDSDNSVNKIIKENDIKNNVMSKETNYKNDNYKEKVTTETNNVIDNNKNVVNKEAVKNIVTEEINSTKKIVNEENLPNKSKIDGTLVQNSSENKKDNSEKVKTKS